DLPLPLPGCPGVADAFELARDGNFTNQIPGGFRTLVGINCSMEPFTISRRGGQLFTSPIHATLAVNDPAGRSVLPQTLDASVQGNNLLFDWSGSLPIGDYTLGSAKLH